MKTSPLAALLVGILLVASAVNAFMTVRYFFSQKELEKLQGQIFRNSQVLTAFERLLNDSIRYSKHNDAIIPILEELQSQIQLRTNNPALPGPTPATLSPPSADTPASQLPASNSQVPTPVP